MRITITDKVVKHDGREYHRDDSVTVSDELGQYFVANGWAKSSDGAASPRIEGDATLDVQTGRHGLSDTHGG